MAYLGQSAITWSATSEAMASRVHLLEAPLRELNPAHTQTVFRAESLDKSQMESFVVGAGTHELVGTVRYDVGGTNLIDLIKAGNRNATLTYIPNMTDPDTAYACKLIDPVSVATLSGDPDRAKFGEHSIQIRLRRTDHTAFQPAPRGTDVLFSFRAGESVETGSFTRVTSTNAPASYAAPGSWGTLTTAKTGKARTHWVALPSSAVGRTIPVLLMESSRKNYVKDSEKMLSTNWTTVSLGVSTGKQDPKGGLKANLISDTSTTVQAALRQTVTVGSSGQYGYSVFANASSNAGIGEFALTGTAGSTYYVRCRITWVNGVPALTAIKGTIFSDPEPWRNNFWRIMLLSASSAPLTNGQTVRWEARPSSVAGKASLRLFGAQLE